MMTGLVGPSLHCISFLEGSQIIGRAIAPPTPPEPKPLNYT